jgi:CRISPR/Cas system-associated endoribonuclease Cas2
MGRRSIARKIVDGIDAKIQSDFQNIVVYDFREKEATHRFWANLKEIIGVKGGEMLQYSVYYGPIQGALAVCDLVEYYGGDVSMFIVLEEFRV